ncbi:hypothetical protein HDU96_001230 [Phlyctochytrium bullatum]|nr:hypothetical protein HDU96_001230 [Phlyctochytrium bullatum]
MAAPPAPPVDWLEENKELEMKAKTMKAYAPSLQISEDKLKAFTVGNYKKNALEKQRELEEAKRKREEDAAAKVYEEFVASFAEEKPVIGRFAPKAWVKGGVINKSDDKTAEGLNEPAQETAGHVYKPQLKFGPHGSSSNAPSSASKGKAFDSQEEDPASAMRPNKKRQLDAFLQEIKENQDREARRTKVDDALPSARGRGAAIGQRSFGGLYSDDMSGPVGLGPSRAVGVTLQTVGGGGGSTNDSNDPYTTNLYLGNLNPSLDEEAVCKLFGRFGPIASVKSVEHAYYRWKLYSLLNGDDKSKWPTDPFSMYTEGPIWIPPEIPFDDDLVLEDLSDSSIDSDDSDAVRKRKAQQASAIKGTLSKRHRMKLEAMIRKLTLSRNMIGTVMVFCIDHADAADEISDTLARSLTLPGTPVFPTKIARLYLLSDVLHNSSSPVPNAWRFRTAIEKHLPGVFGHLGSVWKGIQSRLRAEQMRKMVFAVVQVWEKWMIFTRDYTDGLRTTFTTAKSAAEKQEEAARQGEELKRVLEEQRQSKTGLYSMEEAGDDVDGIPIAFGYNGSDKMDGEQSTHGKEKAKGWISIDQQRVDAEETKSATSAFVPAFTSASDKPTDQSSLNTDSIPSKTDRPRTVIPMKLSRRKEQASSTLPPDKPEDRVKALASMAIPLKAKALLPTKIDSKKRSLEQEREDGAEVSAPSKNRVYEEGIGGSDGHMNKRLHVEASQIPIRSKSATPAKTAEQSGKTGKSSQEDIDDMFA